MGSTLSACCEQSLKPPRETTVETRAVPGQENSPVQLTFALEHDTLAASKPHDVYAVVNVSVPSSIPPVGISCDIVVALAWNAPGPALETLRGCLIDLVQKANGGSFALVTPSMMSQFIPLNSDKAAAIEMLQRFNPSHCDLARTFGAATQHAMSSPAPSVALLVFADGRADGPYQGSELPRSLVCYTFGFGQHHDENLLRAAAARGQGSYYLMESPAAVKACVGDCVASLVTRVADGVVLTISPIGNTVVADPRGSPLVPQRSSNSQYVSRAGMVWWCHLDRCARETGTALHVACSFRFKSPTHSSTL